MVSRWSIVGLRVISRGRCKERALLGFGNSVRLSSKIQHTFEASGPINISEISCVCCENGGDGLPAKWRELQGVMGTGGGSRHLVGDVSKGYQRAGGSWYSERVVVMCLHCLIGLRRFGEATRCGWGEDCVGRVGTRFCSSGSVVQRNALWGDVLMGESST